MSGSADAADDVIDAGDQGLGPAVTWPAHCYKFTTVRCCCRANWGLFITWSALGHATSERMSRRAPAAEKGTLHTWCSGDKRHHRGMKRKGIFARLLVLTFVACLFVLSIGQGPHGGRSLSPPPPGQLANPSSRGRGRPRQSRPQPMELCRRADTAGEAFRPPAAAHNSTGAATKIKPAIMKFTHSNSKRGYLTARPRRRGGLGDIEHTTTNLRVRPVPGTHQSPYQRTSPYSGSAARIGIGDHPVASYRNAAVISCVDR
jgi:hypothetical protein